MCDGENIINLDNLPDRLRYLMKKLNVRQKDFAKACGVSENYISMLVSGRRQNISKPLCRLICQTWGIHEQWLLSGSGEPFMNQETAAAARLRSQVSDRLENMNSAQLEKLLELIK